MNKTLFLSGKITGDKNYKAKFAAAEKALTDAGYIVINPALLPSEGFEWEAYMRITLAMMKECEIVCFLPDWEYSRGAEIEYLEAHKCGKKILFYLDFLQRLAKPLGESL